MGALTDQANDVFRDFVTAGVPASGANDPPKFDIRTLLAAIINAIDAASAGITIEPTTAARDTFYATPANQGLLVYVNNNNGSATDPANGVYEYVSGAARLAQGFYGALTAAINTQYAKVAKASTTVATYADRGNIASGDLFYGKFVYVDQAGTYTNGVPYGRLFEWSQAGDLSDPSDETSTPLTADGWVGYPTYAELVNIALARATAADQLILAPVLKLAAVAIDGFSAKALSTATNPKVQLGYSLRGSSYLRSVTVSWGGYKVLLDPRQAPPVLPTNHSLSAPLFVVGNSLSDITDVTTRWSQVLATALGANLVSVARYSSDARQVYRAGITPIDITVSGGVLPASGSSATISLINGLAPSADASVNPASFLNIAPGNAVTTGVSMSGVVIASGITRHCTISITNGSTTDYKIQQDSGQSSLTLTGAVRFVPDATLSLPGRRLIAWIGNNYFFSGVPNSYGDYTNPQMWVDMAEIVAAANGGPVLLLPVLPDTSMTTSGAGTEMNAYKAANARTEALYPNLFARDSAGRDLIQYLQTQGDGSANDNSDVTNGWIPRSLRLMPGGAYDPLHLNALGDSKVATFVQSALSVQIAPPAITQTTAFALFVTAQNGYDGSLTSDVSVTQVQLGGAAQQAASRPVYADNASATAAGMVVGSEYRTATGQVAVVY